MKSFSARLTLRFALLVTATTTVVLVAGGWLLSRQAERGLEMLHDVELNELGSLLGTNPRLTAAEAAERIKSDADSDAALFLIQVDRLGGEVLFRSDNLGDTLLPAAAEAEGPHRTLRLPYLGRVHLTQAEVGPWRIHIGSPLGPTDRLLRDYAKVSLLLVVGVALASLAMGYGFSRQTLAPIRAIEATARRIRADNLGERIPVPPGGDELASLTRLLNDTFDRLEASFEQVRRFSADASHELKTPLALIRLNVEKLRARAGGDGEARAALDDIMEEIANLNHVIETLLFLAKSEGGAARAALRPVAIAPLLETFAEDAAALAEDRRASFRLQANPPVALTAEPDLLRQLLLNLVANAVSVSPAGGVVALESAAAGAEHWRFTVSDEGPGLPEAQLERVFDRFFRYEAAGAGDRRGHGLGLAICRAIAELHGGRIEARNRADRSGLQVSVTLPVKR